MTDPTPASTTSSYVDETLALLGDRDPLEVLAEMPAWLAARTDGLPAEAFRQSEGPGTWNLTEVLAHLADIEIVFGWRARLTLTAPRPPITGFDELAWVARFDYAGVDPAEALHAFATLRAWNLRVWRAAGPDDLDRCVGVHSERGDESFRRLMAMTAGHDLRHRRQVDRLLAAIA
jgi:uncharacterized damage-inducible protein DinB